MRGRKTDRGRNKARGKTRGDIGRLGAGGENEEGERNDILRGGEAKVSCDFRVHLEGEELWGR